MKVMERRTQTLEKGAWDVFWAKEQKWTALENRLGGFPPKRHTRPLARFDTIIVWERDWESLAAMEAAYEREGADPETQEVNKLPSGVAGAHFELFMIVS